MQNLQQKDRPSFGIGMLCYKKYDTFRKALDTYKNAALFEHADESLVAFNGLDGDGEALANDYGLAHVGSDANSGILGGFKMLAEAMTSDIVLLLENDLPLVEGPEEVARQLRFAREALATGEVDVFRFRHRLQPGYRFQAADKFLRYYRPSALAQVRRFLRPGKARKMIGNSIYAFTDPDTLFEEIERTPEGWFKIPARHITWTNQSIMVRRDFFLNDIIAYAEAHPSNRTVNGFPDIEKELNSSYWRNSGWTIGADRGLFTHIEK